MISNQQQQKTSVARLAVCDESGGIGPVYELSPVHPSTLGRLPSNDIIIDDDSCSRQHCEIFLEGQVWTLRDLGSRNGTFIDNMRVTRDWSLMHQQVIRIGSARFRFLIEGETTRGREDFDTVVSQETYRELRSTIASVPDSGLEGDPDIESDSNIVHRAKESHYLMDQIPQERSRELAEGLGSLHRMALRTAACQTLTELANSALDGLFDAMDVDIGAVLLLDETSNSSSDVRHARRVAYRNRVALEYEHVSGTLTDATLLRNEAVLAEDWRSSTPFEGADSDSLDEMEVRSVICAPIRSQGRICGLIHLYTTRTDALLEQDDLHFTLAVADHCGTVFGLLEERLKLKQSLEQQRQKYDSLRKQLIENSQLVGESTSMLALRDQAMRVGPTGATVLVRGESGVGKELIARLIHHSSERADKPLVCMNCAALSESLLESELFGHEKGAFTGATEKKIGKFEQANQGTLFLDEVGEMSPAIQAKFLRVLEGHPFERVGGSSPVNVNVRVIAATNRHLEDAVKAGEFRQDLYFRLHVVQINIDPLRERSGDIPILAEHFVSRFSQSTGRAIHGLTPAAIEVLTRYHWPGNVRELQNTIERAVILCQSDQVDACDIQLSSLEGGRSPSGSYTMTGEGPYREMTIDALEQAHILATLAYTEWNKTRAAQILAIERSTLDRKLKRYKVSRPKD
ncbi:MAG: sigma 54-interacting transcriptional regulator [Planctomycetaceae bacterium]|nr:sigma 54-interacting transcriptional regulator [Planctomycetaceae bacterium]